MKKNSCMEILSTFDGCNTELATLESVVKAAKELCLDKELSSYYYNLTVPAKIGLSDERNNYINLLSIALDKIENIKTINDSIEKELISL